MKSSERLITDKQIHSTFTRRGFTKGTIRTLFRAREMLMLAIGSAIVKLSEAGLVKQLLASLKQRGSLRIGNSAKLLPWCKDACL